MGATALTFTITGCLPLACTGSLSLFSQLVNERTTLFLYVLLQGNPDISSFIFSRSDIDQIVSSHLPCVWNAEWIPNPPPPPPPYTHTHTHIRCRFFHCCTSCMTVGVRAHTTSTCSSSFCSSSVRTTASTSPFMKRYDSNNVVMCCPSEVYRGSAWTELIVLNYLKLIYLSVLCNTH